MKIKLKSATRKEHKLVCEGQTKFVTSASMQHTRIHTGQVCQQQQKRFTWIALKGAGRCKQKQKGKKWKKKQRNDSALLASTTKTKSMCQQCEKRTKISTQSTYTHSWKTMRVPTHLVRPCAACFELSHFFFPLSAILIFCLFLWAMQPRSIFRLRGSEMAECAIATAAKETNLKKPNS